MINKKLILIASAVLIVGVASSVKSPSHPLVFYEERSFLDGINLAKSVQKPPYKIIGGIIPHHLAVGFIMADFYSRLSWQKPSTIILIGPNHYEKGSFKTLTSLYGWQTPYGTVEPDEFIIHALIKQNLAAIDEDTLTSDHAVAGSMSFVKYYIPNAKVVPILLSGSLTEKESEILADGVKGFVKQGAVIIAPVDFSHYLSNQQAKKNDEITLQVIKDFNYHQLFLMNNDYLDSAPSIGVILMVMQKLGIVRMDLLYHSNSGEIQKNDYIPTTSYFSIAFY